MIDANRTEIVLDEFVDDVVAGRTPRVYERMAAALDVEVEALAELIALFDWVRWMHEAIGKVRTPEPGAPDRAEA